MLKALNYCATGCGIINAAMFNYNMNGMDIIRNNKKTKLLWSERLTYSFLAFCVGIFKIPIYIDYIHIKLLNDIPENYGYISFPKKEIDANKINLFI